MSHQYIGHSLDLEADRAERNRVDSLPFTQPAGVIMPTMTPEQRAHWRALAACDAQVIDALEELELLPEDFCTTCRNVGTVPQNTAELTVDLPCPDCWRGDDQ